MKAANKDRKDRRDRATGRTMRDLARDSRGVSPYVAVIVLIALALLIYQGAQYFGGQVNAKFQTHADEGVGAIPSTLGGGQ
ncbi:MAG TPA: hypothetical protein VKZ63_16415 [Kofleriaceae bacterium]|nr:hypothetical protein [Kofleriaceae bacterium]